MGGGSVDGGDLAEGGLLLLDFLDGGGGLDVPFAVGFDIGVAEGAVVRGRSWCEVFL